MGQMDATSRPQRTLDVLELMLADVHYGLPLDRVVEVVPRVAITRLPELALPVLGFLAYRGTPVAAVDMRHRLGYPARPPSLADHVVIARARTRAGTATSIALVVDRALGVRQIDLAHLQLPPESASFVAGVTPLDSGLLLVSDLDQVLSLEEERAVAAALRALEEPA
jgi:purine-binding chemotaxis protein CheW